MRGIPVCVYRVDPPLIELLDERLGPPLDSYVRGWQVWLEPNGPDDIVLEWRLHPPGRFRMPRGVNPHDLFDVVLQGIADTDRDPAAAFATGEERHTLAQIWEVLEVFPAYGDPATPGQVAEAAAEALSRPPDAQGYADHQRLGEEWKGKRGDFSVGQALLRALSAPPG